MTGPFFRYETIFDKKTKKLTYVIKIHNAKNTKITIQEPQPGGSLRVNERDNTYEVDSDLLIKVTNDDN